MAVSTAVTITAATASGSGAAGATGSHTLACPNESSQATADLACLRTIICGGGVASTKRLHGASMCSCSSNTQVPQGHSSHGSDGVTCGFCDCISATPPTRSSWKARGTRHEAWPGTSWRQVLVMQQSTERVAKREL